MSKVLTDYLFLGVSLIAGVFFLRDAVAYRPKWRSWVEGVGFIAMCAVVTAWLFNWPFRWVKSGSVTIVAPFAFARVVDLGSS